MQQVRQRGATLLKVVSIILIILGAISLVSGVGSVGSGSLMATLYGLDGFGVQYFRIMGILSLITGGAYLVFGIVGVRFCNRAGKEGLLLLLGIILIVICIFTTLYNLTMAETEAYVIRQIMDAQMQSYGMAATDTNIGSLSSNPLMVAIGFILPVLFVIGALLNRMPPKPL